MSTSQHYEQQPKNEVEAMLMGILPPPPPPLPLSSNHSRVLHSSHESFISPSYSSACPQAVVQGGHQLSPAPPPGYPVPRHGPRPVSPLSLPAPAPRSGYRMNAMHSSSSIPSPPMHVPYAQNWNSSSSSYATGSLPSSPIHQSLPSRSTWRAYARDLNGTRARPNYKVDFNSTPSMPCLLHKPPPDLVPVHDNFNRYGSRGRLWRRLRERVRRGMHTSPAHVDGE